MQIFNKLNKKKLQAFYIRLASESNNPLERGGRYISLSNDCGNLYVLEDGGKFVGYFIISTTNPDCIFIERVLIFSKYRGMGFSKVIIDFVFQMNEKIIVHPIPEAVSFWEKMGFEKCEDCGFTTADSVGSFSKVRSRL